MIGIKLNLILYFSHVYYLVTLHPVLPANNNELYFLSDSSISIQVYHFQDNKLILAIDSKHKRMFVLKKSGYFKIVIKLRSILKYSFSLLIKF
jgi:hypothetical protein